MLPDGAFRQELSDKRMFYDQAINHGVGWYEYANITLREVEKCFFTAGGCTGGFQ
jgi:hypothetical protein